MVAGQDWTVSLARVKRVAVYTVYQNHEWPAP